MKNAYRFIFKVDDVTYRDRFQHKRILVAFEKLEVIRPKNEPKRWFVVSSIDPFYMERCNDAHTQYIQPIFHGGGLNEKSLQTLSWCISI